MLTNSILHKMTRVGQISQKKQRELVIYHENRCELVIFAFNQGYQVLLENPAAGHLFSAGQFY